MTKKLIYVAESMSLRPRALLSLGLWALGTVTGCGPQDADTEDEGAARAAELARGTRCDGGQGNVPRPDAGALPEGHGGGSKDPYCRAQAVLDRHCTACHDGKGTAGAPNSLKSYADLTTASPSAPSKKAYELVALRTHDGARPMPPKGLLEPEQQKELDDWIAAGAPPGPAEGCAAHGAGEPDTERESGWNPAECDEIYRITSHAPGDMKAPFRVPAGKEINTSVAIDAPWGDEEVQAIGFKPVTDNAKVLHHWILNAKGVFIVGWAPGNDERPPLPRDVAVEVPSGKRSLSLNLHYYNLQGAAEELDQSGVDVCVLKKGHFRPKVSAVAFGLGSIGPNGVLAPAGAVEKPVTSVCKLTGDEPVHLLTAAPHAHKYAVRMRFTATQAGREIVLHDAPFRFGEQGTYGVPGGEVVLNKGDTITTSCYYTNPTAKNITIGESTENEMCFNFARYYPKGALKCGGALAGALADLLGVGAAGKAP